MSQRSLSVWFVCRLCRGSFGEVDAFIEHKKQKHFTQFQNTTSIVFKERELGPPYPVIVTEGRQLADQVNEPTIKIEVNDEDPFIPFSYEITDEPHLDLFEPKSKLITYEGEIIPDNENSFFGFKPPEQNPYVLLKRLTSEEIQRAGVPQHHSSLLKYKQKSFANSSERPHLPADVDSIIGDLIKVEHSTENQPSSTVSNIISTTDDLQFQCKLCSKQLQSDGLLKIHVGICALYHEDRNRFCVSCNRKFSCTGKLNDHRLRFHGTEEEKLSLYKFKCHFCPKKYRDATGFEIHLDSHKEKKQKIRNSNPKLLTCSHPNCGQALGSNSALQKHIAAVHLGVRPFSCDFPKCNKTFSHRGNMERHFLTHTGERPFKCTADNCDKAFTTSQNRSFHHRLVHSI